MLDQGRFDKWPRMLGVVGALMACSAMMRADDTELYIANGLSTGQGRPQVLIIFDRVNPTLQIISDEELQATMLYKPIKALAPMILPQLLNQADAIQVPELLGPSE